jgi:hypothetical protein
MEQVVTLEPLLGRMMRDVIRLTPSDVDIVMSGIYQSGNFMNMLTCLHSITSKALWAMRAFQQVFG